MIELGLTEILGGLAGVVILVLSMMVKSSKSDKKAAELERDQAVQKAQLTQKRVEAHEKLMDHENKIKSSIENSRNDDVNTIADRMRKKANHRNGTGN